MLTAIILLANLSLVFGLFLFIRSEWVFKQRQALWDNAKEYYKLPSYHTMVWKFWIWDVEKFK